MKNEQLKTYDEYRNLVGIASRKDVHRFGYWHEVFSCWFIGKEKEITYIYLQLRSSIKNDYPNLLDVTVAGHLLASETVQDGVREIKEELGICVAFENLISLGLIKYSMVKKDFIDNEIANMFLCKSNNLLDIFNLNEEVSGIVKIKFKDFIDLWLDKKISVTVEGFKLNNYGEKVLIYEKVEKNRFVPYQDEVYKLMIERINAVLNLPNLNS